MDATTVADSATRWSFEERGAFEKRAQVPGLQRWVPEPARFVSLCTTVQNKFKNKK